MINKFQHVCIHEASHLVMFFYLGGSLEDIREVQIKPNSGYVRNVSFPIGENYFTSACLALAGPLSDIKISGMHPAKPDMNNAEDYIRTGLRRNQTDRKDFEAIYYNEYQSAWAFTESIVEDQTKNILMVSAALADVANKQKQIVPNKVRKIGQRLINDWKKEGVHFYDNPAKVSSSDISIAFI